MEIERYCTCFNVIETELNNGFWKMHFSHWEGKTYEFLLKYLNKEKTFIDIGAWIGPISIIAQNYSKQCICYEPDKFAYNELVENINLNNFNNIIAENLAVSIYDKINLGCEKLGQSGTRDSCKINLFEANCITIKEIFDKYNLNEDNVSAIKIDIEGHESELLKDDFLKTLNIPMHISLHPGWISNKTKFFNDIKPFFEYKNIDTSQYLNRDGFYDIEINI